MSLGDLSERIVLHVFEGKTPFDEKNLKKIASLRQIYELDLTYEASHQLVES
jgi:hypothetical protein